MTAAKLNRQNMQIPKCLRAGANRFIDYDNPSFFISFLSRCLPPFLSFISFVVHVTPHVRATIGFYCVGKSLREDEGRSSIF